MTEKQQFMRKVKIVIWLMLAIGSVVGYLDGFVTGWNLGQKAEQEFHRRSVP